MPPDVLNRCIEPFFTTKSSAGTGMGLTTANSTVKRYGGALSISSRENEGTCVRLELPVWFAEHSSTADTLVNAKQGAGSFSVLLIDDDSGSRDVLAQALEMKHHKVDTAASGQEGMDKLKVGTFDLVIVDRAMPGMNGDEFVRIGRKTYHDLPIIMLTGFGSIMTQEGDVPNGIDLLMSKPVTATELDEAIQKVMIWKR
jgi:CheY-like chemotaxis protein